MNKITKLLAALTLTLAPLTSMVGCASTTGSPTTVITTTQLVQDENAVTQGTSTAVTIYLLSVSDPAQRVKQGEFVYSLSQSVKGTITQNGVSLSAFQAYAGKLIASSGNQQQIAGLVLNAILSQVQGIINQNYSTLAVNEQFTVVSGLITAAANGLQNSTLAYADANTATTQPSTLEKLSQPVK